MIEEREEQRERYLQRNIHKERSREIYEEKGILIEIERERFIKRKRERVREKEIERERERE